MTWMVDRRCASLFPRAPRKGPVLSEERKRANIERLQKIQKVRQRGLENNAVEGMDEVVSIPLKRKE